MFRRLFIFLTLLIILASTYQMSLLVANWHYIVPAEAGQMLYAAAFDSPMDEWEQYQGNEFAIINDGALTLGMDILGLESPGNSIYAALDPYFADFDASVDARVLRGVFDGNNNNAYGLVFRLLDDANYYVFLVSSDGTFRVKRVENNQSQFLSDWVSAPAIDTEIGAVNTLRVVGQGDRFQFYINGELQVLCIPDDPNALSTIFNGECLQGEFKDVLVDDAIGYGRLGVAAELDRGQAEPVHIAFDNVIVYGPDEIAVEIEDNP